MLVTAIGEDVQKLDQTSKIQNHVTNINDKANPSVAFVENAATTVTGNLVSREFQNDH